MRACTVISSAELPAARVLAASLDPGSQLPALLLDGSAPEEPFEVLRPADLEGVDIWKLFGLPERRLRRYLEPFLLARFAEPVVLLAAGVRVRPPLDALLTGNPTLVPRALEPAGETV